MISTETPSAEYSSDDGPEEDPRDDVALVDAIANGTDLQNQLYVRYRRPLLQVILHRRIERDAADDLLQRTFLIAVRKIRGEGLDDPRNLGGFLYRTARNLAIEYWRKEHARKDDRDVEQLFSVEDEALSLDERLDSEQLAEFVRELMDQLPLQRDREVLERFYLHEESRVAIRASLNLTDRQFNQVLWRARVRFGEILRGNGVVRSSSSSVD